MRDPAVVGLPRIARRVIGEIVTASVPLDSLGRRRSPASVPGYLAGRPSRNRGRRYPPDPPRAEEIIAVMRYCGDGVYGARARGLIAVLWRAGLRIQEALDLNDLDLDRRRGSVLVRRGKGGPTCGRAWQARRHAPLCAGALSAGHRSRRDHPDRPR